MASHERLKEIVGKAVKDNKGKLEKPVEVTAIPQEPKDWVDATVVFKGTEETRPCRATMSLAFCRERSDEEVRAEAETWIRNFTASLKLERESGVKK